MYHDEYCQCMTNHSHYDSLLQQMNQPFIQGFIHWNLVAPIEFSANLQEAEDIASLYLAGGPL